MVKFIQAELCKFSSFLFTTTKLVLQAPTLSDTQENKLGYSWLWSSAWPVVSGYLEALTVSIKKIFISLMLQFPNANFALSLSQQIHKQAPPLEDIAEDCSLAMRSFLEQALERNPALRSSASKLLKDEAINPPREDQPRCWSLDSALEEVTHTMLRQQSQHLDTKQGKDLGVGAKELIQ